MRLTGDDLPASADVVVIGAGVVGAACARALARAGRSVCVLDRDGPAAGTSSSGEGNLLVSDKPPGPELDLARHSLRLWRDFAGPDGGEFEFEAKGGLVVAASPDSLSRLAGTVAGQRAAGVEVVELGAGELPGFEPRLAPDLVGGAYYPQDCQVQPMLAVRALLTDAVRAGARVVAGAEVTAGVPGAGAAGALEVRTSRGVVRAPAVIVAAGVWSATVARLLGGHAPVIPRRGHIVVTEPLPPVIRHKVYEADYVSDVDSDDGGLLCSAVVEGTRGGPVLLGSSRELVGLDRRLSATAVATIARRAARLFPFLREVRAIRAYLGFRPASPDHLPIIGPDGDVPGLWHATGHEGAGVGLALGTADLLRALITGAPAPVDPAPFAPSRPTLRAAEAALERTGPERAALERTGLERTALERAGLAPVAEPRSAGSVTFRFEGRVLTAPRGASIGAALWAAGVRHWRTTRVLGRPRALFCGIGQCFDCLVRVGDGPAVRACVTILRDGDEVSRGDVAHDDPT